MTDNSTHWRPAPRIRTKALALVCKDRKLLVAAIRSDDGTVKGWRPLGGEVEFGERAEETVLRELAEEVGATGKVTGAPCVLENIYSHHGDPGHEIAFVFPVSLQNPGQTIDDEFIITEDDKTRHLAAWVPVDCFLDARETIFPDGLQAKLDALLHSSK